MKYVIVGEIKGFEVKTIGYIKELEIKGNEVLFITRSYYSEKYFNNKNINVINYNRFLNKNSGFNKVKFNALIKKYSLDIKRIRFPEFKRFNRNKKKLDNSIYNIILKNEKLISEFNPDIVLGFEPTLINTIIDPMCKYNNICFLEFISGTVIPNTHTINFGFVPKHTWVKRDLFSKKLTQNDIKIASNYIKSTTTKKIRVAQDAIKNAKTKIISLKRINNTLKWGWTQLFDNTSYSLFNYIHAHLAYFIERPFKRRLESTINEKEKYFFFPMHIKDDFQLTYINHKFFRQDLVIKEVAKKLPSGYKLYVKEHIVPIFNVPYPWIKRISKIKNVRLISPEVNAHDLIQNSEGIITIASDVGWEGLLWKKPVILLGSAFYKGFGLTLDVDKMNNLTKYINQVINKRFKPKDKEVEKIVFTIINSVKDKSCYEVNSIKNSGTLPSTLYNEVLECYSEYIKKNK